MLVRIRPSINGFLRSAKFANGTGASDEVSEIDQTLLADISNVFVDPALAFEIGATLYRWLFGSAAAPTAIYPTGGWEPIYLCFENGPEQVTVATQERLAKLASLPWELLFTPLGGYLARGTGSGVFRIADAVDVTDLPAPIWPMRVVAVSGADLPMKDIRTTQELQDLRRVFVEWGRSVNIEVIEQATNKQLEDAIRSDCPTILHYCGHALQLSGNPAGLLTAGDAAGGTNYFSVAQIGGLGRPKIGLVVLNACVTAKAEGAVVESIWQQSLANMFLLNGSRAVIAMQEEFAGTDAKPFAEALYLACLAGKSVEEAVTQARLAIDVNNPAWAIPSLTLACMPDKHGYRLFDRARAVRTVLPFGGNGDQSPRFTANFHRERRILSNWLSGTPSETSLRGPVAMLVGEANAGKSHFMRWALSNVAHLNHQFRYIDFAAFSDKEPLTLVRLLRAIRDGAARNEDGTFSCDERLRAPFRPVGAFNAFNESLNRAFGSDAIAPAAVAVDGVIHDQYGTGSSDALDSVGGLTFDDNIAQLFHAGLQAVAGLSPLFVVIDLGSNASKMDISEFKPFITKVVIAESERWNREGQYSMPIRFVFCCHRSAIQLHFDEWTEWFRFEIGDRFPIIEFQNNYKASDIVNFIKEMYWFKGDDAFYSLADFVVGDQPQINLGACRIFNKLVKESLPNQAKIIDDPVTGVGEMR